MTNALDKLILLSIVLPAHNEGLGIPHALDVIKNVLISCTDNWEIIVVDDGSNDDTFQKLQNVSLQDQRIKGIRLSRNFGKEAAILAGLSVAKGEAIITMDSDLQHPPSLIPNMINAWKNGAKVVDGVKRNRHADGVVTKVRARFFNFLLSKIGGINIENSSDYKLLDREVVDTITKKLPERQRFYRGLSEWVGYSHVRVPFDVDERVEGVGKWSLWTLLELAITALISFTSAPLRVVTFLGVFNLLFGAIVATDALIGWFRGVAVSGFATIIMTLLIIGSLIMISLGIIGEYIAKIYDEIKARPSYLIEQSIGIENDGKK